MRRSLTRASPGYGRGGKITNTNQPTRCSQKNGIIAFFLLTIVVSRHISADREKADMLDV
jgi:hypothetical protein